MKKLTTFALAVFVLGTAGCNPEHPTITPRSAETPTRPMVRCAYSSAGEVGLTDMDAAECIGAMGKALMACQEKAAATPPPTTTEPTPFATGTVPEKPKAPSMYDDRLTNCLTTSEDAADPAWKKDFEANTAKDISPTSPEGLRATYMQIEDEAYRCGLVFARYLDPDSRRKDFTTSTVANEIVKKRDAELKLRRMKALTELVSIKAMLTPEFFCWGECVITGRWYHVDTLVSLLADNRLEPKDMKANLTGAELARLRNQGVREMYDFWKTSKDVEEKGDIKYELCAEIEHEVSGLKPVEISSLKCDEDEEEAPEATKADENPTSTAKP